MKNYILIALISVITMNSIAQNENIYPNLLGNIEEIIKGFDQIPNERKEDLKLLAEYIKKKHTNEEVANLTFICTHNSRRSHMSQIWAATASAYYGIESINTFSGGTEATAFNPRAVLAMKDLGFEITEATGANPHYKVKFGEKALPMDCFSKKFTDSFNPQSNFCAVMTCSHADETCPIVQGADDRVSLPYDDPKAFDGTPLEAEKYTERSIQIAREIFYSFSLLK